MSAPKGAAQMSWGGVAVGAAIPAMALDLAAGNLWGAAWMGVGAALGGFIIHMGWRAVSRKKEPTMKHPNHYYAPGPMDGSGINDIIVECDQCGHEQYATLRFAPYQPIVDIECDGCGSPLVRWAR